MGYVSRTSTLLGFSCSTVSRVYQELSTTQRKSSQLTTVGSIGINIGQHPCVMLLTPCRGCQDSLNLTVTVIHSSNTLPHSACDTHTCLP